MIRVYVYDKCSTCRNALKWLDERGIECEVLAIKETPPSDADLKAMLESKEGELRKLFNTSGMDYRSMGLKDKIPTLSETEAFALLQSNGMLVKRPFLIGDGHALTGFREKEWVASFGE
ncbi:arsenate reductase family protein [Roseibacillus persicicus]|uniref:ArsC family transcriptional regulator n=1 Tax=Roseibacillus persicicus TaxID=454148 RepID=A0A918U0L6_9BACT|nr:arsenate reductase family protein [Roseibacillus persicicus]MDQ8192496.1 arsenate reductase family protein [Roseibacillus persicicus]GHC67627.1 ArsC family transcriptional regulator [Roseibacillus persicicus]